MTLTTETVQGSLAGGQSIYANANVMYVLNGIGLDDAGNTVIPAGEKFEFTTDANGYHSADLWPNTLSMAGTNTSYTVQVKPSGETKWRKLGQIIVDQGGPWELEVLLASFIPPSSYDTGAVALMQGMVTTAAEHAATAANHAASVDPSNILATAQEQNDDDFADLKTTYLPDEFASLQSAFLLAAQGQNDADFAAFYEVGTWTPELRRGAATFTYGQQLGRYTRIGDMVIAEFQITQAAMTGGNGPIQVKGWPFPANIVPTRSTPTGNFRTHGVDLNITSTTGNITPDFINDTTLQLMRSVSNAGWSAVSPSGMSNGFIEATVIYWS